MIKNHYLEQILGPLWYVSRVKDFDTNVLAHPRFDSIVLSFPSGKSPLGKGSPDSLVRHSRDLLIIDSWYVMMYIKYRR